MSHAARDQELCGLTLYSKYELLSVSLALFDGSLSLALTVPNNLHTAAEVARLCDLLVARLVPTEAARSIQKPA